MPIRIYRITHIENLRQILEQGGIWCGNEMSRQNLPYVRIGNRDLTLKRSEREVTCCEGGNLNDYVPFYFCPRSVMLYLIHKRHESTYGGGQEPVIHLISSVEEIQRSSIPCLFTDKQAYGRYANQIDVLNRLSELDWDAIKSNDWGYQEKVPDRRERKMAEFLAYRFVPWELIAGIGVYNKRYKDQAEQILATHMDRTKVQVMTAWYY